MELKTSVNYLPQVPQQLGVKVKPWDIDSIYQAAHHLLAPQGRIKVCPAFGIDMSYD